MKRILLFIFLISSFTCAFAQDGDAKTSAIFDAMEAEMARTLSLTRNDPKDPKIHFVAFKVTDFSKYSVAAARGGFAYEEKRDNPSVDVYLRVGNNKEDNSFFDAFSYSQNELQGSTLSPDGVRAGLWSASDAGYKQALDVYTRKQGYKSKKNEEEVFDDFSDITPMQDVKAYEKEIIPTAILKEIAIRTSKAGALKELEKFNTSIGVMDEISYFLSSEGAKYTRHQFIIEIDFIVKARTKNGFEFNDVKTLSYAALKDLPSVEELENIASEYAKQMASFTKAEKGTAFIGPVWLSNGTSARLFEDYFIDKIGNTRKVIYDSGNGNYQNYLSDFALKENLKVLSSNFDVIENPQQEEFNGKKMVGAYKVDDEGAKAESIHLVQNGILKDLPTTRSLIKNHNKTNGHAFARWGLYAKASVKNLLFFPHETTPVQEFKQKFMNFCKAEGLEYCYKIVSSRIYGEVLAIKIDANTGVETPVYGLKIPSVNARTLRDIKFSADDLTLYNTLSGVSYVVPSVILSEAELTPSQKVPSTKYIVPRPNI